MANIDDMYGNDYVRVEDISNGPNKRPVYTITRITEEDLGNRDKLVVHFAETEKMLPLNKTNALFCAETLGKDTDNWTGAKLTLAVEKTMFQGKRVPCIRVVIAEPGAKPTRKAG